MNEQVLRVAALQLQSSKALDDNLQRAEMLIASAAEAGAKLAVLPESFARFGAKACEGAGQELSPSGPIRAALSNFAERYGIALVGGTLPVLADDGRAYASCFVYDSDGRERGCYRKQHLFDAEVSDATGRYAESDSYCPGDTLTLVDMGSYKLGVAVCYDLRFAEQFIAMRDAGAEVIAVPAAFTEKTGRAHWQALLRARAIETQSALIGANQGGEHDCARRTSGESSVVNAWGEVLASCDRGEAVVLADIDFAQQQQWREQMPVMQHRRYRVLPL